MAKRDLQIVLKRLTDEDLQSFGVKTNDNVITATQQSRKRKRETDKKTEVAEIVSDCISRNTRSKARAKLADTNTNSIPARRETKRGKRKPANVLTT